MGSFGCKWDLSVENGPGLQMGSLGCKWDLTVDMVTARIDQETIVDLLIFLLYIINL